MYLLIDLESRSPRSRCQRGGILVRALFLACRRPATFLLCPYVTQRETLVSLPLHARTLIPSWGPAAWLHLNLMLSQRSHLQRSSQWGLGLQHKNWGAPVSPHYLCAGYPSPGRLAKIPVLMPSPETLPPYVCGGRGITDSVL